MGLVEQASIAIEYNVYINRYERYWL